MEETNLFNNFPSIKIKDMEDQIFTSWDIIFVEIKRKIAQIEKKDYCH